MVENIFWFGFLFIVYTYAGYPALIYLLATRKNYQVEKREKIFPVSVVIAARNEEVVIGRKIEDLLGQDYPRDQLEIITVSDGSNDSTNEIVRSYSDRGVKLLILENPAGKPEAINQGVLMAKGEIIVFTDARQYFRKDAIRQLVANFSDASIGCVSGELYFIKDGESVIETEMGAYWRFEKAIRKLESRSGSVMGATGAIYAIRKSEFRSISPDTLLDDVLIPMNILVRGLRVIFDSSAKAFDVISKDISQEWKRKVRTLAGNWQLLTIAPGLFIPWLNPGWWRFLSHKFFRVLIPFFLFVILVSSIILKGSVYQFALGFQCLFYGSALMAALIPQVRSNRLIGIAHFFLILNAAALMGFWYWITGRCAQSWKAACKTDQEQ